MTRGVFLSDLHPTVKAALEEAKRLAEPSSIVAVGWVRVLNAEGEWTSGYTWWYETDRPPLRVFEKPHRPLAVTDMLPIYRYLPPSGEWCRVGPDVAEIL